jgi:hypothetical protein
MLWEGTAKSDPIFHNRLVNMVVNHIMMEENNHWLINSMNREFFSTKDHHSIIL